jgi:hypothetical protein
VVLDQENPDLFKWVTGQAEPPAALAANPAFAVRALASLFLFFFFPVHCMVWAVGDILLPGLTNMKT